MWRGTLPVSPDVGGWSTRAVGGWQKKMVGKSDRNCSDHVTSQRGKSKTGTHTPAGEFQALCGEDKGDTKTH